MGADLHDINLPARFSEFIGADWASDEAVWAPCSRAATTIRDREWTIPCFVDTCDEPRSFGWRTSDVDNPGARWLRPRTAKAAPACGSSSMGPGPSGTTMAIASPPGQGPRAAPPLGEVYANMQRTVEGVKQLAETST